ncbi:hypothetical protein CHARACLAT_029763 [Characodon lateralis]|uniref:Uncharacterized protein n=1 Tax=Characodon lateralis TaxID=208331 RepID=A0ABU7DKX2_9TELE|nr:hypothetical protein [Characodon lateralis]
MQKKCRLSECIQMGGTKAFLAQSLHHNPYFFLAVILVKVDLDFICPKNILLKLSWLFRCSRAKSNLAFLFFRLMSGLHLAVNPLYSDPLTSICVPPGQYCSLDTVDVQVFLCCFVLRCFLSLSGCTKLDISLMVFLFLISQFIDGLVHLYGELLRPHAVCSQQNPPNASTTPQINSTQPQSPFVLLGFYPFEVEVIHTFKQYLYDSTLSRIKCFGVFLY